MIINPHRARRVVIGGAVLTDDPRAGRTCVYCLVTFGTLDPVPAPSGVEGMLFLAAHRACVEANQVPRARRDRVRRAHRRG